MHQREAVRAYRLTGPGLATRLAALCRHGALGTAEAEVWGVRPRPLSVFVASGEPSTLCQVRFFCEVPRI